MRGTEIQEYKSRSRIKCERRVFHVQILMFMTKEYQNCYGYSNLGISCQDSYNRASMYFQLRSNHYYPCLNTIYIGSLHQRQVYSVQQLEDDKSGANYLFNCLSLDEAHTQLTQLSLTKHRHTMAQKFIRYIDGFFKKQIDFHYNFLSRKENMSCLAMQRKKSS